VFYGTEYAVRPWRLARLIQNLVQHRQESRLDKSLQDLAHRIRNKRPDRAANRARATA
jgi:hypothetical protein